MTAKEYLKKSFVYKLYHKFMLMTLPERIAFQMIWIRFFCKIPSKHLRIWIMNRYDGVDIAKHVPIYSGLQWWKGPFVVEEGSTIGFDCHIDCRRGGCILARESVWLQVLKFGLFIMITMIFILSV